MAKLVYLLGLACLLVGCSANKDIMSELSRDMAAKKQYSNNSASLEEIAKMKPQIAPPIRIAVTQPSGSGYGGGDWDSEQIKEIESWLPGLKATGLASELVIIPRSLYSDCSHENRSNCGVHGWQMAAARLHADAVLVIDRAVKTDSYVNPSSFLNLTIIGMWLVPAHHKDSYAVYEAYLADAANGYIYGTAHAEGEAKSVRPYIYADAKISQSEASLNGLKALGLKIVEAARQAMAKLPPPKN